MILLADQRWILLMDLSQILSRNRSRVVKINPVWNSDLSSRRILLLLMLLISRDLASVVILTGNRGSDRNRRVCNRRTNDLLLGLIRSLLRLYRTHETRLCHTGWATRTEICRYYHVRVDVISAATVEIIHSRGREKFGGLLKILHFSPLTKILRDVLLILTF